MNRILIALVLGAFVLGACKTTSLPSSPDNKVSARKLKRSYLDNQINYKSFSSKIKVHIKGTDLPIQNVTASLRIKKDSIVWISVTAIAGLEVMRILITNDSLKVLDRFNSKYTARSIDELKRFLPEVSMAEVQNLLIGQSIAMKGKLDITTEEDQYKVKLNQGGMDQVLWLAPDFYTNRMTIAEPNAKNSVEIYYKKYKQLGRNKFPVERRMLIHAEKPLDLELKYVNIKVDESLRFPFKIPAKYARD
jgi:hypothetical protein